jgi:hypothetical protein
MQSIANILLDKFKNDGFACGSSEILICGFLDKKCSDVKNLLDPYKI